MKNNRQGNFIITIILFVLIGGSAFFALTKTATDQQTLIDVNMENLLLTEEISKNQQFLVSSERGYLLLKNISFLKDKNELNEQIDAAMQQLEKSVQNKAAQALLADSKEIRNTYTDLMTHSISELNNGNADHAMDLVKEASEYAEVFEESMTEFADIQKEVLKDKQEGYEKFATIMKFLVLGLTIIALIISFMLRRSTRKN